jgi:hypothetical protein
MGRRIVICSVPDLCEDEFQNSSMLVFFSLLVSVNLLGIIVEIIS